MYINFISVSVDVVFLNYLFYLMVIMSFLRIVFTLSSKTKYVQTFFLINVLVNNRFKKLSIQNIYLITFNEQIHIIIVK